MAGNVPEYDDDHQPPQWPRLYRPGGEVPGDNPLDPADAPGSLPLDAANQDLDHLGKIGIGITSNFVESVSPAASHTMSEFLPEKHVYIVQFIWGNPERMTVDGFDLEYWDAFIGMQNRIREQMLREFNTHVWIHYVVYPVMVFAVSNYTADPQIPVGGPWHRWKTWDFVPSSRVGTEFDLPSWCSVNNDLAEQNLSSADISTAISAVQALGGPGLGAGRTGLGIVNSYPTFNVASNTGLHTIQLNPPAAATIEPMLQTFVTDRNTALGSLNGQDGINQADTKPAVVDFSARGSGTDPTLLALDGEYYLNQGNQSGLQQNFRPFGSQHGDFHGNGPNHPDFFPYPHPAVNFFYYLCENEANGGYLGRSGSGWMAGSTVRYFAREGFVEDVNVEMDDGDPPALRDIERSASYDGLVGEIGTYVGTGALNGNAGQRHPAGHHHPMSFSTSSEPLRDVFRSTNDPADNYIANTSSAPQLDDNAYGLTITRSSYHAAILAAQVIWQDHMGAPGFLLSCPPVTNLAVGAIGTNVDFDRHNRENNPTPGPPHEGLIERPFAQLQWNGGFGVTSPLPDSPLYGRIAQGIQNPDGLTGDGGYQKWADVNVFDIHMPMWEMRWAFDSATLLSGGGNRVNWVRQTTGNQFGATSSGAVDFIEHPGPGSWIPVSHGFNVPVEIFFTVVSYGIFDSWDALTLALFGNGGRIAPGKMILKQFNSGRQFTPCSGLFGCNVFPFKNLNPTPYPRSQLDTRYLRDNDFLNVKDPFPEEMVIVSAMLPADPEA